MINAYLQNYNTTSPIKLPTFLPAFGQYKKSMESNVTNHFVVFR